MKQKITKDIILKENKFKKNIIIHSIIILFTIGFILLPIYVCKGSLMDIIISMILLFLTIGILFGGIYGLYPLIRTIQIQKALKNDNYYIEEDEVYDKYTHTLNSDVTHVYFKKYSTKTDLGLRCKYKHRKNIDIGDAFYLIYINNEVKPIEWLSAKEYSL